MVARSTPPRAAKRAAPTSARGKHPAASTQRAKTDPKRVGAPAPGAPPADSLESGVRAKLVRDSFTMPKSEYGVLAELKLRAAKLGRPIKKGELLRAGVAALRSMLDRPFLAALEGVPTLKPGRPKGTKNAAEEGQRPRGKKHRKSS